MVILNIDGNLGNQNVSLSDNTGGVLSGVRVFGSSLNGTAVIQWSFVPNGGGHEGFVFAGSLTEGLEIGSLSGKDKYKIHFTNK